LRDSEIRVKCGSHGESSGAYVCNHLVEGRGLGFNWGRPDDDPDKMCPDAWCDRCDADVTSADVRLVCTLCYGVIRARNWREDEDAYDKLLDTAVEYHNEKHASFTRDFRINEHKRYDWNQGSGQLVFSNDGKPAVICDIAFVGSISRKSETWMWSWANTSHDERVKAASRKVRDYGEKHRFEFLAGGYWSGKEADGWCMTAIATYLLGGIGTYRSPDDDGFLFMVITDARWAQ
jgi:hypothetical protein